MGYVKESVKIERQAALTPQNVAMYGNKSLMFEDKEVARSLVLYDSHQKSARGSLSPPINNN